jgi:hypothetical protein
MHLLIISGQFHRIQNRSSMLAIVLFWLFASSAMAQASDSLSPEPTVMPPKRDFVIYADNEYYASFPEIILMKDQLVVYFERQKLSELRASPLHPHYQPASKIYFATSNAMEQNWTYSEESPPLKDVLATTRTCFALPGDQFLDMRYRYIHGTMKVRHLGPTIFQGALYKNEIFQGPIDEPSPCPKAGVWAVKRLGDGSLLASGHADCSEEIPAPPVEGVAYQNE